MTTHTMPLSFTRPPLNLNQRLHWRKKAAITRELRREAWVRARGMRLGLYPHITVTLHWQAPDRRRRDSINPTPTHKALVDGLVDAGVIPDDTPQYVTEHMPVIHQFEPGTPASCWLEITAQENR
ncbi:hypothetical protein PQI66_09925 [Corynebacterium sp. USCH3]|uniref:hypothetical protein n=1 Tax=Corynebacterium sp. USCH3 TaxID=3024840 RepID=UPI0030B1B029